VGLQPSEIKGFSEIPAGAGLVVASDIHIRSGEDSRYLLLCELVRICSARGVRTFVLNGDIFDFFFGWRSYFTGKYNVLFNELNRLAAGGCDVWFVVGNHEFAMEPLAGKFNMRIVPGDGAVWVSKTGRKVLIAHGDLLRHDPWYMAFRAVVRSGLANVIAAAVPQRWLDLATLWFATTSRKKDKYRTLHHEKVIASAKLARERAGADDIIIGHFHHPYDEDLGGGSRLLSVSSWDEPSCLVMTNEGVFRRVALKDSGGPVTIGQ
jgi:UDP-2,3-diacylglucosamine pyrophosphatase LpxH